MGVCEKTSEILFDYLRDVIYSPEKANLNVETLSPEFSKLGQGLIFLAQQISEINDFSQDL